MKVTLERPFKNHNVGEVLDVSQGVYDHLKELKCISVPKRKSEAVIHDLPPEEEKEVIATEDKDEVSTPPVEEKKEKSHKRPPRDKQVKGSPRTKD